MTTANTTSELEAQGSNVLLIRARIINELQRYAWDLAMTYSNPIKVEINLNTAMNRACLNITEYHEVK